MENGVFHCGAGSVEGLCASPHKPTAALPVPILIIKRIVLILDTPLRMPCNPSLAVLERAQEPLWALGDSKDRTPQPTDTQKAAGRVTKGREGLGIFIPNSCPNHPDTPKLTTTGHIPAWGKSSFICRAPRLVPAPLPVGWDL